MKYYIKGMLLLFSISLVFPLLSGCWDSVDIEKRAVILGIAIDKAGNYPETREGQITHQPGKFPKPVKKMIKLTAQIAVPGRIPLGPMTGGGGGSNEKPVWILSVVGHTLDDAMVNLQQELADEIFLGHLRVIFINEDIAREGIDRFNDYLRRNSELRRTAWVAVTREEAKKYLEVAPPLERIPSLYFSSMVEHAMHLGKFPPDFIGLFWTILASRGQDPFLPYLIIKGNNNVQINGLAYFTKDKMIGDTTPLEIGAFMAAKGVKKVGYGAFVNIPGTKSKVLVSAVRCKSKVEPNFKEGKPFVTVKIHCDNEISEKARSKINLRNPNIIKPIEKETAKELEKSVTKLIHTTQKKRSDIFGFGEYYRAKHPIYWDQRVKTKERWHKIYKDIGVHVDVKAFIRRQGMKSE